MMNSNQNGPRRLDARQLKDERKSPERSIRTTHLVSLSPTAYPARTETSCASKQPQTSLSSKSEYSRVLVYNISTGCFRSALTTELLQPDLRSAQPGDADHGPGIEYGYTVVKPRRPQTEAEKNPGTGRKSMDRARNVARRTIISIIQPGPSNYETRSTRNSLQQPHNIPAMKTLTEFDWYNPPLLTKKDQYMVVAIPRWLFTLDFNWRSNNYGLSTEEKRAGKSVVWNRRVSLPPWVWIGRNFGVKLDLKPEFHVHGRWNELWIERGGR